MNKNQIIKQIVFFQITFFVTLQFRTGKITKELQYWGTKKFTEKLQKIRQMSRRRKGDYFDELQTQQEKDMEIEINVDNISNQISSESSDEEEVRRLQEQLRRLPKMQEKNLINMDNAFQIELPDHIRLADNSDFKKNGIFLSSLAHLYGFRVDSALRDTYKVKCGILRIHGVDENKEDVMESVRPRLIELKEINRKSILKYGEGTLEKNPNQLNIKTYETVQLNPFFHQTNKKMDLQQLSSMLMYKPQFDKQLSIIIDKQQLNIVEEIPRVFNFIKIELEAPTNIDYMTLFQGEYDQQNKIFKDFQAFKQMLQQEAQLKNMKINFGNASESGSASIKKSEQDSDWNSFYDQMEYYQQNFTFDQIEEVNPSREISIPRREDQQAQVVGDPIQMKEQFVREQQIEVEQSQQQEFKLQQSDEIEQINQQKQFEGEVDQKISEEQNDGLGDIEQQYDFQDLVEGDIINNQVIDEEQQEPQSQVKDLNEQFRQYKQQVFEDQQSALIEQKPLLASDQSKILDLVQTDQLRQVEVIREDQRQQIRKIPQFDIKDQKKKPQMIKQTLSFNDAILVYNIFHYQFFFEKYDRTSLLLKDIPDQRMPNKNLQIKNLMLKQEKPFEITRYFEFFSRDALPEIIHQEEQVQDDMGSSDGIVMDDAEVILEPEMIRESIPLYNTQDVNQEVEQSVQHSIVVQNNYENNFQIIPQQNQISVKQLKQSLILLIKPIIEAEQQVQFYKLWRTLPKIFPLHFNVIKMPDLFISILFVVNEEGYRLSRATTNETDFYITKQ